MGLDQYAFAVDNAVPEDQLEDHFDPKYYWRKHAKLHEFMERLFEEKTGKSCVELNCGFLELTLDELNRLEKLIQNNDLPESEGGFFYGHQFQDETATDYKEQDLEFCQWAIVAIETKLKVYYSCWW